MADFTVLTNDESIKRRLKTLVAATRPTVEYQLRATLGEGWLAAARRDTGQPRLTLDDSSGLLNSVLWAWRTVFATRYPDQVRSLALLLRDVRNDVGHERDFEDADMAYLLAAIGDLEALLCGQSAPLLAQSPPPPPRFAVPPAAASWSPAAHNAAGARSRRQGASPPPAARRGLGGGCALLGIAALAFVALAGLGMLLVASRATPGVAGGVGGAARGTLAPTATRNPVAGATATRECFPQTGHCAEGALLAAWRATGGLRRHGAPLTGEREEALADGRKYTVQYFERSRLERPVGGAGPVQAGTLGRVLRGIDPPASPAPGARHFPATGHNVGGRFLAYWQANGGEAGLGLPLGEERRERLEDGREYTVQWFERARLEWHPGAAAADDVQLGQLGRLALAR